MSAQKKHTGQKGFTLIVIVMLIVVLSITALALVALIRLDMSLVGQSRRNVEAREVADGAIQEMLNRRDMADLYPELGDTSLLVKTALPPEGSFFASPTSTYQASIGLMRIVPMGESSQGLVRAVVYEAAGNSDTSNGATSAEIISDYYRPMSWEPGTQLPSNHHR